MELSIRLNKIVDLIEGCNILADIGTDHGYVTISAIHKGKCSFAIASDINKGPIEKAEKNIKSNGLEDKIQCRLGSGLSTLKVGEVDTVVIAGMGGNLIRDILEADIEVVKSLESIILEPTQNPEILRKYLIENGYEVLDEELCYDEEIYYEIMKVRYGKNKSKKGELSYEISDVLIKKNHPLIKDYILHKIHKNEKIIEYIKDDSLSAQKRKDEIMDKMSKMKEIISCL